MNEQSDLDVATMDRILYLVERHDDRKAIGLIELERQVSRCQLPGYPNPPALERSTRITRARDRRYEPRAIPVAHRGAGGQERIVPPQVGVSMDRHGCDLQLGTPGSLVQ